jgi:hypothetical protein
MSPCGIDELREKEEREKNRRPGGSVVVFSSPFAGGRDSAEDRTIRRRRVVKDTGIVVIE